MPTPDGDFLSTFVHLPLSIYVRISLIYPPPSLPISCHLCVKRQLPDLLSAVLLLLKRPRRFYKHWKVYPHLWRWVGWLAHTSRTHTHTHTNTHTQTHTHKHMWSTTFSYSFCTLLECTQTTAQTTCSAVSKEKKSGASRSISAAHRPSPICCPCETPPTSLRHSSTHGTATQHAEKW